MTILCAIYTHLLFCCRYTITGWCHLVTFLADGSKFLSTWYLVSLLATCFLSNCFPDRECCSPWRNLLVTITLAITALVVYLNMSLNATLFYLSNRPVCMYIQAPESAMLYLDHTDAFVNILVPLILNSVLVLCLCLIKWCCKDQSSRDSDAQLIDHKFAMIHTILWVPYQVAQLHNNVSVISLGIPQTPLKGILLEEIFKFVSYFNISINIFVLLIANSLFRKQLKNNIGELFCKVCRCSNRMRSNYLGYSSAAVQTSFIESNVRTTESI